MVLAEKARAGEEPLPMQTLTLGDQSRVAYAAHGGESERPCLIFLHEGLGSIAQWRDFPQQLCRRTGCAGLVYDRVGHGKASPLARPRSIHYLHRAALEELPQVIDGLLPGQPYMLVGHSDGGSISLISGAERHPGLRGIITVSAHVFVEQVTIEGVQAAAAAHAEGKMAGLVRYHGDKTEALFRAWSETWLSPWFRSWNIEYLLPAIEAPLLVLQGRDDQYGTAAQVETIVGRAGGPATPLVLEDCGHAPHLEFPDLTLDLMACFVNRIAR